MSGPGLKRALLGAALIGAVAWGGSASAAPITFNHTGALQSFEITTSGDYRISAFGASGGASTNRGFVGGLGAQAEGTLTLLAGTMLNIVVGGTGVSAGNSGGGGGGSFVYVMGAPPTPLVVSGGGGGAGFGDLSDGTGAGPGLPGLATADGGAGTNNPGSSPADNAVGAGGTSGQGGGGGKGFFEAGGGGGGFLTAGLSGEILSPLGEAGGGGGAGSADAAGGARGGDTSFLGIALDGAGGYGGGGGSGGGSGGGGGGFGGGGGGGRQGGGGGGGSFVFADATDVVLLSGVRSGDGLVTVEFLRELPPVTAVPEPGTLGLLGLGLLGLAAARRRVG